MMMANDNSKICFDDLMEGDDDGNMSMDLQSIWEILGESPDPPQVAEGFFELIFDNGKVESSANSSSLEQLSSGSLTDQLLPVQGYSTTFARTDENFQYLSSHTRDGRKGSQYKIPNGYSVHSFPDQDGNYVSDQVRCLEGDGFSQYRSHNPYEVKTDMDDAKSNLDASSLKGSVPPENFASSMMDVDVQLPWDLCDNFNLQTDGIWTNIKDVLEEVPTDIASSNGGMLPEVPVGGVGKGVLQAPMASFVDVNRLNAKVKCEDFGYLSPMIENLSAKFSGRFDNTSFQTFPCSLSKTFSEIQATHLKDERNDELVGPPLCFGSLSFDSVEDNATWNASHFGNGFIAGHIMHGVLPPSSSKKDLFHLEDAKEDIFLDAKRAHHSLDTDETCGRPNLIGDDFSVDAQALEQPPILTRKHIGCTDDEKDGKIVQPRSMSTHFSELSCQMVQDDTLTSSSHFDNDLDLCILEDASELSRSTKSSVNRKPLITSQCSTFVEPLSHSGMGSVRLKANDERSVFRAALQDLSQPKSEASPPDGFLAVPLLRHQRIALSWMVQKETASAYCSGGILADDQGLGKTVSTIALILKERASPSGVHPNDSKHKQVETLNLDEDDDCVSEVYRLKRDIQSSQALPNGSSIKVMDTSKRIIGRPAAGTLVVCPTSVLRQWAEELNNKVTSKANLSVLVYHGSNRTKDPFELAKYDVVLTTYSIVSMEVPKQPIVDEDNNETAKRDSLNASSTGLSSSMKRKYPSSSGKKSFKQKKEVDSAFLEAVARPLARVGWFRVVLDEAQSIKNHRTQVARACWGLRAKRRWCLSGTPIQNAIDDLYSYFRFLRYDPYASYKSFCSTIKVPINRNSKKGYKKLQAVLKTIMLRRTKGTLLDGEPIITLPPKSVKLTKVDFSNEEREFYCRLEADSRAQFAEYAAAGTVKKNYVNILLMLLRLRQACNHPLLVKENYESASLWRSSIEMAKKLPREKQICLLNCLEASAICDICNDAPEDAVVTGCGHVFCNQCISDHLMDDTNQCPNTNCKGKVSASSIFPRAALKSSLSEHPGQDSALDCDGSQVAQKLEPSFWSGLSGSSKIKAALEVLELLSNPPKCMSGIRLLESVEDSDISSCPLSEGQESFDSSNSKPSEGSNDAYKRPGEKAIVFSQWTRMLDLFETSLKNSSINYRRLDGTMSVLARDKAVKDFNTLPEVSVMIMSLKAASLGLNMVAACHVLLLDLWWNPTTEDQAIDRAHRIGQTRPVTVVRLTVKDTVEDRILALQQRKRKMVASAFGEDERGTHQTRLTVDDLKYLFMA